MSWNGSDKTKIVTGQDNPEVAGMAKVCVVHSCLNVKVLLLVILVIVVIVGIMTFLRDFSSPNESLTVKSKACETKQVLRIEEPSVNSNKCSIKHGNYPASVSNALEAVESKEQVMIAKKSDELLSSKNKRIFKTGVEQVLCWLATAEPGVMPLPIPKLRGNDKERLASILIGRDEIKDDDDPKLAAIKSEVNYAKAEMSKFIRDGGTADEFLDYYYQELKKAHEIRQEARRQAAKLEDSDPELAEMFIQKVNEKFSEQGIKKLPSYKKDNQGE